MKKLALAALSLLSMATVPAHAVAVYSTDFSTIATPVSGTLQGDGSIWGVSSFLTGTPGTAWSASLGNFDYLKDGNSLYRCVGNAGGCIELGGSTGYGAGGTSPPSQVDLTLTLTAGSYTVAFDYARQLYGPAGFKLKVDGSEIASILVEPATGAGVWNAFSQGFSVGASGPVTISFVTPALDINKGAQIDNFNVTAVPEPQAYALMLAGLAAMGFVVRRRRGN